MAMALPTPRYSPVVRIGNWFEDNCLERDKVRAFMVLRDSGQLLVEKTRLLFDNFHKDVALEAPKEFVRFGAIVQLNPAQMNICGENNVNAHPALSVIINERVVRKSQKINEDCELTIAMSTKPSVRNAFRIVSGDDSDRSNELLKYGQQFRLQCMGTTEDDPLFLYSAPNSLNLTHIIHTTFQSRKLGEINLPLGLIHLRNCGPGKKTPLAHTNWFCRHITPVMRFETDGKPLPSNKPLIITHVATNRNLAAEKIVIQTLFGPEYLVSVQNYRDAQGRERWQNMWTICNGQRQPTV